MNSLNETFEIFPIKAVSIIFDLDLKSANNGMSHLHCIRSLVLENVGKMESDDKIYIFSDKGELEMAPSLADAIATISEFKEEKFNVALAIKESIFLVNQYDPAHKAIFVFTNRYKEKMDIIMNESLKYDLDTESDCNFFFYGIGFGVDKSLFEFGKRHERVKTQHFPDPSDVRSVFEYDFSDLIVVR